MVLYQINEGLPPFLRGNPKKTQQDALHLQIPENLLATFLILIKFTSFQHPPGIALKKIWLK